jgi:glycerol-3-phosphate O-acyltransferase/dihydroxyacetone phosphate acyltransferase
MMATSTLLYNLALIAFKFVLKVFFHQIAVTRSCPPDLLDTEGTPVIFAIAPHSNQFVDALLLCTNCRRQIHFLCAEKSTKRKIVGFFARMVNAIPVKRPMDMQQRGIGTISPHQENGNLISGNETRFLAQISPTDYLYLFNSSLAALNQSFCIGCVESVQSDSCLRLTKEQTRSLAPNSPFFIVPKINHEALYSRVFQCLAQGQAVGIFPEGMSHDRTQFLPLKPGIAQMAFGATEAFPEVLEGRVKIIPVTLAYLHAHKLQSRAAIEFGKPLEIPSSLLAAYRSGEEQERKVAIQTLLDLVHDALCELSCSAPDEASLAVIKTAVFLHQPGGQRIRNIFQRLKLERQLSKRLSQLKQLHWYRKVEAFNERLINSGIGYYQLDHHHIPSLFPRDICVLFGRFLCFLPGFILNAPALALTRVISYHKAAEAKRSSNFKISGMDVVASWKIIIALVVFPAQYLIYWLLMWRIWKIKLLKGGLLLLFGSVVAFWGWLVNASQMSKTAAQIAGAFAYDEALLGEYAELRQQTERVFAALGLAQSVAGGAGGYKEDYFIGVDDAYDSY